MAASATFQQALLLNSHLGSLSSISGTKLCTPSLSLREKTHNPSRKTLSVTCTAVVPSSATPLTGFADPVQEDGRVFNFAAGSATLPPNVIKRAQAELYNWRGSRMSIMEMSHRGNEFTSVIQKAESDLRELLAFLQTTRSFSFRAGRVQLIPLDS